ncbi:MAG: nucleotidyltransferase family protein [Sciscionella sp.]
MVPDELLQDERQAAIMALAVPVVLERVCDAYQGLVVLMKGPEAAAHYPSTRLRPFRDLDLLVDDPDQAHRALRLAGFIDVGDPLRYVGVHHLAPLGWPGLPLAVELHRELNHPRWLPAPAAHDLFQMTRPSATGANGLRGPVPAAHAVLLALHSWAHAPLRRILDLIDVSTSASRSVGRRTGHSRSSWHSAGLWGSSGARPSPPLTLYCAIVGEPRRCWCGRAPDDGS